MAECDTVIPATAVAPGDVIMNMGTVATVVPTGLTHTLVTLASGISLLTTNNSGVITKRVARETGEK